LDSGIRIAVDAMGADRGPEALVRGAYLYLRDHINNGVQLFLIGQRERLQSIWDSFRNSRKMRVDFVDAAEIVEMNESVARGLKKRQSSLAIALQMHKRKEVDAIVSAGNTGACMAASVLTLGCLEGVIRPAIAAPFPTSTDRDVVLLDVGANVDMPARNLYQFAEMGSIYASYISKISRPRVGLLSIGEEKVKGNEATLQTHKLLQDSSLNFIGNVEGHDILSGKCDVIVTDGFTGNILLKFGESIKSFLMTKLSRQISSNLFSRIGAFLMHPFLGRIRKSFDSSEYGGAPLLGINGVMIICHGSSNPRAIRNAIRVAEKMIKESVNDHIRGRLSNNHILEKAQS